MGAAQGSFELRHAAGRSSAHPDVARPSLRLFFADESGATAIEYAMIAGLVSVFIYAAMVAVGQNMEAAFYDKLMHMFD
jgi:Flp pilus assembly pilin Flp